MSGSLQDLQQYVGTIFLFRDRNVNGQVRLENDDQVPGERIVVPSDNRLIRGISSAFLLRASADGQKARDECAAPPKNFLVTCRHCIDVDGALSCSIIFPAFGVLSLNLIDEANKKCFEAFPGDDLAVFPDIDLSLLQPFRGDWLRRATSSPIIPTFPPVTVELGDNVCLLGYMRLSWDQPGNDIAYRSKFFTTGGPVLKAGAVAHELVRDTSSGRDERYFLIDATGRGGMSGCPVYKASMTVNGDHIQMFNRAQGTRTYTLVGVYRGRESNDLISDRVDQLDDDVDRLCARVKQLENDVDWILDKDRTSEIGKVIPAARVWDLIKFHVPETARAIDNMQADNELQLQQQADEVRRQEGVHASRRAILHTLSEPLHDDDDGAANDDDGDGDDRGQMNC